MKNNNFIVTHFQGLLHEEKCDDAYISKTIDFGNCEAIVNVVADGCSSSPNSHIASKAAAKSICEFVILNRYKFETKSYLKKEEKYKKAIISYQENKDQTSFEYAENCYQSTFQYNLLNFVNYFILKESDLSYEDFKKDVEENLSYMTTIIATITFKNKKTNLCDFYCLHIGDGMVVAYNIDNQNIKKIFCSDPENNNGQLNETFFTLYYSDRKHIHSKIIENLKYDYLFLSTDGTKNLIMKDSILPKKIIFEIINKKIKNNQDFKNFLFDKVDCSEDIYDDWTVVLSSYENDVFLKSENIKPVPVVQLFDNKIYEENIEMSYEKKDRKNKRKKGQEKNTYNNFDKLKFFLLEMDSILLTLVFYLVFM